MITRPLTVGVVGIGTLGLLVIGLALWWPGRQRLKQSLSIPANSTGRALLSASHRTVGIYLAPVLMVIAITGTMLAFRQELIYPMESEVKTVISMENKAAVGCIINPGLEDYLFAAKQQFPEAMATHIKLPRRTTRPVEVTLRHGDEVISQLGLTWVELDAGCATVLRSREGRALTLSITLTETVVGYITDNTSVLPVAFSMDCWGQCRCFLVLADTLSGVGESENQVSAFQVHSLIRTN